MPSATSFRSIQLQLLGHQFIICVDDSSEDGITQALKNHPSLCLHNFAPVLACVQPGDTVLDIGSHIGTFAIPCAKIGAKVLAIEASPINCELTRRSINLNVLHNLQLINAIAGSKAGQADFIQDGPYGRVLPAGQSNAATLRLPVLSVDSMLEQSAISKVDILKIDVEGYELEVLQGMPDLFLKEHPRLVLYETHGILLQQSGKNWRDLYVFFRSLGYRNYRLTPDGLMPINENSLQLQCVVDNLAVKELPERLAQEPQVPPPDLEEQAWLSYDSARAFESSDRLHLAGELSHAPAEFFAHSRARQALELLGRDSCPEVREAASWYFQSR